jgi:hypothetical protein
MLPPATPAVRLLVAPTTAATVLANVVDGRTVKSVRLNEPDDKSAASIVTSAEILPVETILSNDGSAYATPIDFEFDMINSF